jgi:hypothetical protein
LLSQKRTRDEFEGEEEEDEVQHGFNVPPPDDIYRQRRQKKLQKLK